MNETLTLGATPGSSASHALYLFPQLQRAAWWRALEELLSAEARTAAAGASDGRAAALEKAYASLVGALAAAGHADLLRAAAAGIILELNPVSSHAPGELPAGLRAALERDLTTIRSVAKRNYAELLYGEGVSVPPLEELAAPTPPGANEEALAAALKALLAEDAAERANLYLQATARFGSGAPALHSALTFSGGELKGIPFPATATWGELVGVEEQLKRLATNIEALLAGKEAHHTLLYGPRGSGKSTAVRGLLERYSAEGLRLVELPPSDLITLPRLQEALRAQPGKFVIFVDDLAFSAGEEEYKPLKSLLEGSLASRPSNLIVLATSNRRHLVMERMSDRPAPEDDVHGWDTHHERLALADRFALTLTFPSATQRAYLEIVRALAARHGLNDLNEGQAIRFAEWGNGYSGRAAKQFITELRQSAT